MQNILRALGAANLLTPITATQTSEATSAWVAVPSREGLILVVAHVGVINAGSLTWTFTEADNVTGTGAAAIVPVDGALTAVTTSNDNPNIQLALFDARAPRGFIQIVGTMAGGATSAVVSAAVLSVSKY